MSLADLGVAELARGIRTGDITSAQVVEDCLQRIRERDPQLNAFSVVLADEARREADARDEAWTPNADFGPLYGVPVAIKEENDVAGCVTTFGGLANRTPAAADSSVVRRLREAGAVIIGKTTMPEFGQWPFTESRARGLTRNPWNRLRSPGGSSGGTAVAVAAGMVPVGIGGDGGGSIRIPAASCGLFGLKPERGRVSSGPAPHLWWALGTIGPITRSVLDSAMVYDAIRGNETGDVFTAPDPEIAFTEAAMREPGRLRIGWTTQASRPWLKPDPVTAQAVREMADLLGQWGHDVRPLEGRLPDPTAAFVPQFFAGVRSEADAVESFARLEPRTREVCRRGAWVTPKVRDHAIAAGERLAEKADRFFDDVDVILTPTLGARPARLGQLDRGGVVAMMLRSMPSVAFTSLWNVTGHPAASVPTGVAADGLPTAVQFVGRRGDEGTLLSLSAQVEQRAPWAMPPWPAS